MKDRDKLKPFLCKCDHGMTLKVISEDFYECPRCGGLILKSRTLQEIDKDEMLYFIIETVGSRRENFRLMEAICTKFGTKKVGKDEIERIANEAIADKIGYYSDDKGIVDVIITAIHKEMGGEDG